MRLRAIGWLMVTALLALAVLGPTASRAIELNPVTAAEECPEGTDGFKIDDTAEDLAPGVYTFGAWSVTIYDVQEDGGETASFSFKDASHPVLYVFVKGGRTAEEYDYTAEGGVFADEDLTAPDAPAAQPQALRRFAERYSRAAFERALHAAAPELQPLHLRG